MKSAPAAVREILVRAPNWLGDLVMATPGLRALRSGFPEARITLQVRPGLEAVLAGSPHVDRIHTVTSYHRGLRALLAEARRLRTHERFELGLCLPDSFSSAALMRLGGVGRVVGYRRGVRALLLHQSVPPSPEWGPRRMVARERSVLGLVASLGIPAVDETTELFTTHQEERALDLVLRPRGLAARADTLVGLAPGASYGPSKRWPPQHFARVGDALARFGARPVLIGAPDEVSICAEVAGAMTEPVADLSGQLDPGTLKALARRLALLIANDAGARHVAVAFGVPCIVFLGPTSLARTDANLGGVAVFETEHACRPCYRRECPIDHRCLREIRPDDVIARSSEILGREGKRHRVAGLAEATA